MRLIVSNITSPSHKLAEFLSQQFNKLRKLDNFSLKNSLELTEFLSKEVIHDDEMMVSFDIAAFYPSVPINGALSALSVWLDKQNIDPITHQAYTELASICLNQNVFMFREKCYKQSGGSMGNPLSPFACNQYMCQIEAKMQLDPRFPRLWRRYVDDCWAVIKRDKLLETIEFLNSVDNNIQFTSESEDNDSIPFLDLLIKRNSVGKFEFDIYRKQTSTVRYITNDSYHHHSHKHAAFNSMIHRLVNVPLSTECYNKEWQFILDVAIKNGYNENMMTWLLKKHQRKHRLTSTTSFSAEKALCKRVAIHYNAPMLKHLNIAVNKYDIQFVPSSRYCQLKSLLPSNKDSIVDIESSGIYKVTCSNENCDAVYIGQTRRSLKLRSAEHASYIKKKQPNMSALADHAITHNHRMDVFKLVERTEKYHRLNALESIHIYLNKPNIVNKDDGPMPHSILYSCL